MADATYIEKTVTCTECGKEMQVVAIEGTDFSNYLCPKCTAGEFDFEED